MTNVNPTPVEDYQELRHGCALVDYTGAGVLRVAGAGAPAFLGNVTTRNVDFLLEGQISIALLLNDEGAVLADAMLQCHGTYYLVDVWPDQAELVRSHLVRAAEGRADVTVTDETGETAVLAIEGPSAYKLAQQFTDFPIPSMSYRSFVEVEWRGIPVVLSRVGVSGEYGYKFHLPAAKADELRAELVAGGARPVGREALDVCRMESRFVNLEREDGTAALTPFDLGLQWMVDFQHDFAGKEKLLARWADGPSQRPVCWVAAAGATEVPAPGTALQVDGTDVGQVVYAVWSPGMDAVIGTARVGDDVAAAGVELTLAGSGHEVRTVSAPFLRSTSLDTPLE